MTDDHEQALRRAAAGGDEDARRALHVSEFRRGARHKLLVFVGKRDGAKGLHLVSHYSAPPAAGALCQLDARLGLLNWRTWAGPDGTLDPGRCPDCHRIVLDMSNEAFGVLFRRQVALGRLLSARHPEDSAKFHLTTGRDLKDSEWGECGVCHGSGFEPIGLAEGEELGVDEEPEECYWCSGRGWLYSPGGRP